MNTADIQIQRVDWSQHHVSLRHIREEVFVVEQEVPAEEEWDEADSASHTEHFLAYTNGTACGTVRVVYAANKAPKITRLAVLKAYRGQGVARALLRAALIRCLPKSALAPYLHAQTQAKGLYVQMGFQAYGDVFDEAGIEHIKMVFDRNDNEVLAQALERHTLSGSEACTQWLPALLQNCRQQLDIVSQNLQADWLSDRAILDALSACARRDRRSSIRILTLDSLPLQGQHRRLVDLYQRLPSKIQLRRIIPNTPEDTFPPCAWIADRKALTQFSQEDKGLGMLHFHNPARARALTEQFDTLWTHASEEDPRAISRFI